jgi:Cadherin domain
MHDLALPHDVGAHTVDINDSEQIIGNSAYGPFLFENGNTVFLQNTLPANSGLILKSVVDINNLGQIVGTSSFNGVDNAFLLSGPLTVEGNQPPKLFVNSSSTNLTVYTTTPGGTVLNDYNAFDPDAGQTLTFSIVSGNATRAFSINSSTGVLSLTRQLRLPLTHNLRIRVTDNGTPPLSNEAVVIIHVVRPS